MDRSTFTELVKPFTLTSTERIHCLYDSLEHIRKNEVTGDCVECGVFKGGNILGIMEYLDSHNIIDKKVWLYDTFTGMTVPEQVDRDYRDNVASEIFDSVDCIESLNQVKKNLSSSSFPAEKVNYVVGDVCETLHDTKNLPETISLLRLDTDWYASTKMELEVLWHRLERNGVLIIDDYGHWKGCKKAVDEFFDGKSSEFVKVDYTAIYLIKT
jgi:O-methyltransferase